VLNDTNQEKEMNNRYKIGFSDGVKSFLSEKNPDMIPIVDMKTCFAFGVTVALATDLAMAQKIVDALNRQEDVQRSAGTIRSNHQGED
jgi:hypothetical protein